jgi:hypothetical protein
VKVSVFSALFATPVPPLAGLNVPATVTAPDVAVLGVSPVVPNEIVPTVPAVVASVPDVGSVTFVAPVDVNVMLLAPDVARVEPLASVNVPVVVETVKPLILVAVAAPSTGVVSVGDVARTTLPVPVLAVQVGADPVEVRT